MNITCRVLCVYSRGGFAISLFMPLNKFSVILNYSFMIMEEFDDHFSVVISQHFFFWYRQNIQHQSCISVHTLQVPDIVNYYSFLCITFKNVDINFSILLSNLFSIYSGKLFSMSLILAFIYWALVIRIYISD